MLLNYTISELITILKDNTNEQPKARYSNNTIIAMLESVQDDYTITLEPTRSSQKMVNRGSLVEILVKNAILEYVQGDEFKALNTRADNKTSDLDTSRLDSEMLGDLELPKSKNIEIKFSTSFSYATTKTNNARYTLVVNTEGVYLVESKNLNKDTHNKIKPDQPNGYRLNLLSDLLGYWL